MTASKNIEDYHPGDMIEIRGFKTKKGFPVVDTEDGRIWLKLGTGDSRSGISVADVARHWRPGGNGSVKETTQ